MASSTSLALRSIACGLALSLATPAHAAVQSPTDDPAIAEVKDLYEQGRAKYDLFDYAGAIELWTRAYSRVPAGDASFAIRNNLAYNIATAREKAFEMDKDVQHLRQAKALLERYLADLDASGGTGPEVESEKQKTRDRVAALTQRIEEEDAAVAAAGPAPAATTSDKKRIRLEQRRLLKEDPELAEQYSHGRKRVIGGAIMIPAGAVAGIIGLAVLGANAVGEAIDGDEEPNTGGRVAAAIFGLGGLGLVVGGGVLLGLGAKEKNGASREALRRAKETAWVGGRLQNVAVVPTGSSHGGGLALSGRF